MSLGRRQAAAEVTKQKAAVEKHAAALFNSPHGVVLGNPKGDVTFVEFFDYNCGYCKRAMGDMLDLINFDPNLRVTLKEFPVLSPGSVEAAPGRQLPGTSECRPARAVFECAYVIGRAPPGFATSACRGDRGTRPCAGRPRRAALGVARRQ